MSEHENGISARAFTVMAAVFAAAISMLPASRADAAFCAGPGYTASQLLDATHNVVLEWSACGAGIDFQISANTTGWVGVVWGPPPPPGAVDGVRGDVVAGSPTVQDVYHSGFFGWVHTMPAPDTLQNLSDIGGSESSGVTTVRFSRLLNTGDTAEDLPLSVVSGNFTTFYWGIDTLVAPGQGYVDVDLSQGAAHRSSVPEPTTLALFALGLAGLGLAARRRAS